MFYSFHNPLNSDMDYEIFNLRTDVYACDCTRERTGTVRESAPKVDSERKNPLPRRGNRTCVSDVPVRRSTYIPTHVPHFL